jgi:hypothetical protein
MKVHHRYFLRHGDGPEREVNEAEWVLAERLGGFRPNGIDTGKPATAGFTTAERVIGRIKTTIEE